MLIAHFSDIHLGKRPYNLEEREYDIYDVFREAIERVLEDHIDILLLSGDIFDKSKPLNRALKVFEEEIAKLTDRNVKVYAISGDHDYPKRRDIPPILLFKRLGVTYLWSKNPYTIYRDVFIGGLQHIPKVSNRILRDRLKYVEKIASKSDTKKRVLVLHQSIKRFLKFSYELTMEELPRGFDYYAMGHIHRYIKRRWDKGWLVYPGSMDILDISEIPDFENNGKGFVFLDLSGDEAEVYRIKLDNIRKQFIIKVKDGSLSNLSSTISRILTNLSGENKKPIIHLVIRETIARSDLEELRESFSKNTLLIRILYSREKSKEEVKYAYRLDLRELFIRELNSEFLGEFAYELFKILREGGEQEATKLVFEFFKKKNWKGRVDDSSKA